MKTFLRFFFKMKLFLREALTLICLLFAVSQAFATHNRAGEIVYRHISGYKYEITIYTYCYTLTEADRDELELDCGDGSGKILLTRQSKTLLDDLNEPMSFTYLCKNIYKGVHTFSGPGTFTLYMEDPNRNEGVENIPNSVNVVFSLKTTLVINPITGDNSSPVLLNAPMDKAALNKTFVHNPGAYDPDGDSLSYKIAVCLQQDGQEIVGYTLPPVTDSIYVNPLTGDFVWEKPSKIGFYNVAMVIEEWRNKIKIGEVLRDIQVEVIDTDNHSPVIRSKDSYCVVADSLLKFNVSAHDPDGDFVKMTASGGPFVTESSAKFGTVMPWAQINEGVFSWNIKRLHVRRLPYEVLFKAVDSDIKVPLTTYKTVKISVIAPKPHIVSTTSTNSSIRLTWDKGGNYNAVGYRVYRTDKPDSWDYMPSGCETGLPASAGYQMIAELTNADDTTFNDNNDGHGLDNGFNYCYRVTAVFADGAESQVSDPSCKVITRSLVAFTKVSVEKTDLKEGAIHIAWLKPEHVDTISVPGPYYYEFYAAHDTSGGVLNGVFHQTHFPYSEDNKTEHDTINDKINTVKGGSMYKICFENRDKVSNEYAAIGSSSNATSVFLKLSAADRRVHVSYDCDVPWRNEKYEIFRKDPGEDEYKLIAECEDGKTYTDYDLKNGEEYWYLVKTTGYYSAAGLPTHIENFSQEASAVPIDTIAPCVKTGVKSLCMEGYNRITWQPDTACGLGIAKYFLNYSETLDGQMRVVEEFAPEVLTFDHYPETGLAGCYAVTAADSAGNEGVVGARECVDMCDYYRLPNVFTPNADGKNDLYHPVDFNKLEQRIFKSIDHIDMTITNRWGKVVFKTTDPAINWDAKDQSTGTQVPDGVYFYRCTVYEHRLTGIEEKELEGFITVFSKKTKN